MANTSAMTCGILKFSWMNSNLSQNPKSGNAKRTHVLLQSFKSEAVKITVIAKAWKYVVSILVYVSFDVAASLLHSVIMGHT